MSLLEEARCACAPSTSAACFAKLASWQEGEREQAREEEQARAREEEPEQAQEEELAPQELQKLSTFF